MRHWLLQVFIALDQLVNALLGGWADETLSSRAWRMEAKRRPWGRVMRPLIDVLGHIDPWRTDPCSLAARYGLRP